MEHDNFKQEPFANKPVTGKNDYAHVPWELVRFDFENTPISLRMLAQKYGIKHEASIRQRILRQGWRRNMEAIASNVTNKAVALGAVGIGSERATGGDISISEEASDVDASISLARRRLNQVGSEIDVGDKLLILATNMVECLTTLTDEKADGHEVLEARRRMTNINPEKETLASLAKTAAVLAEAAILIKRRAFGMQTSQIKVLADSKPITEDGSVKHSLTLLQRLPPNILSDLRNAAQELTKLPGKSG